MKQITFEEAKRLINSGQSGFYCVTARQARPHDVQMCVFAEGAWWLCNVAEFRLVDHGIVGDANCWSRMILVHADEHCKIAEIVQRDAQAAQQSGKSKHERG